MAFIFYDTETTGTDPAFDQILQFAAILTDDDLVEQDRFSLRCRNLPYILPSLGALLITGMSIDDVVSAPLSHYEMIRQVRAKLEAWSRGGAVFAGWNSLSFDEEMLRQAYYQTLHGVFQTNTGGNGRADIMRMAHVVAASRPDVLVPGTGPEGKRSFRLGLVAAANGIVLDNAHEALADAKATLDIARLIKARVPGLWDSLIGNAHRAKAQDLIAQNEILFFAETRFGASTSSIVAPLGPIPGNATSWAMFDLGFDPAAFEAADTETLARLIAKPPRLVRRAALNKQPGLVSVAYAPATLTGDELSLEVYRDRARRLRENSALREAILRLVSANYTDSPELEHVEQKIYRGFPTASDQRAMAAFHASPWEARPRIIREIEDPRFRQLGKRIVASERPDLLSEDERGRWQTFLTARWNTDAEVPWHTIPKAGAEIAALTPEQTATHQSAVARYRDFLDRF